MNSEKNNPLRKFDVDLSPIRDFARQMDSFFNHSFKQMHSIFNLQPFWVDVHETDSHFIVTAELQGYERDQIKIEILGNRLRIVAEESNFIEKVDDKHKQYSNSQSYQLRERFVTLPFDIPEEETKASFKNGILRLTIPKSNSQRKIIDIDD